jgi:hypothetical protein
MTSQLRHQWKQVYGPLRHGMKGEQPLPFHWHDTRLTLEGFFDRRCGQVDSNPFESGGDLNHTSEVLTSVAGFIPAPEIEVFEKKSVGYQIRSGLSECQPSS